MSIKHRAALRLAALALPMLVIAGQAMARDADRANPAEDRTMDRTVGSGAGIDQPATPQAPVGHRQPRAAELPAISPTAEDRWLNEINRDIDRKLQICRGC
jgi:hypothetical protein